LAPLPDLVWVGVKLVANIGQHLQIHGLRVVEELESINAGFLLGEHQEQLWQN